MPDSPLISVIVPVYNVEKYLRKCLDSICGQTYRNLEILCVNDGSTDGSAAILEEYAARDARIKVFTQPNGGLSAARNTGLEHATGEWVTGVDSDDYLEPDAYEYALSHASSEDDIIMFEVKEEQESPNVQLRFYHYRNTITQKPTRQLILNTDVVIWNKLWRKSLIDRYNVRFPEGLLYEDAYFWFVIAPYARQIRHLPEEKYHYVLRQSSIMGQAFQGNTRSYDQILITEKILAFYRQHPLPAGMEMLDAETLRLHFSIAKSLLPTKHHPKLLQKSRDLAEEYNLFKLYPSLTAFLRPCSQWKRFFVTHNLYKSSYGIGPIKLATISYRNGTKTCRVLGVKISQNIY